MATPVAAGHRAGGVEHQRDVERGVGYHFRRFEGHARHEPAVVERVLEQVRRDSKAVVD